MTVAQDRVIEQVRARDVPGDLEPIESSGIETPASPQTLAETTGQTYEQLDQAYRNFMPAGETVAQPPAQAAR